MVVKYLLVNGGRDSENLNENQHRHRDSELFRPLVITADTSTLYQFVKIGICFQVCLFFFSFLFFN